MKLRGVRKRFVEEESGFTLPEMMVTMMVMLVVMYALYSIFDMSIRVFSFGNDKVEAVENARVSLERMEREIRAAHPYDKAGIGGTVNNTIITNTIANPSGQITFGNDTSGDRVVNPSEVVSYSVDANDQLLRNSEALAALGPTGSLEFEYLKSDGNNAANEGQVNIVRISLTVDVDGRVQTLTTDVSLRNRRS